MKDLTKFAKVIEDLESVVQAVGTTDLALTLDLNRALFSLKQIIIEEAHRDFVDRHKNPDGTSSLVLQ